MTDTIRPNLFLVGAPKCGTSALYNYLKAHPQIYMAEPKELNYFAADITSEEFIRDRGRYEAHFSGAGDHPVVGEASVWHLYSKTAARNIRRYAPDAKILAMVRNPVEMIYAYHSQRLFNGTEHIRDFAEAINAIEDRKRGRRLPASNHPLEGLYYLDIARYSEQLDRYYAEFDAGQIHVIVFDDFKHDTAGCYRRVLEFLGVDSEFPLPNIDARRGRNSSKRFRNEAVHRFLSKPPRMITTLGKIILPSQSLRRGLWHRARVMNIQWEPRPALPLGLRIELQEYFRDDIERLGGMLGRDLSSLWLAREQSESAATLS